MTQKKNRITISSVVGWAADMRLCNTPEEVGIVLEADVKIKGSAYKFVKVLWNTGNVANVPVDLIRTVKIN